MLTPKTNSRTCWPEVVSHHLLFLFNIMSFSMFFCRHFSDFLSDHQVRKQSAMSKRCQKTTSNEGSPMAKQKPTIPAKARPINLVMRRKERERLFTKFGSIRSIRGVRRTKRSGHSLWKLMAIRFKIRSQTFLRSTLQHWWTYVTSRMRS